MYKNISYIFDGKRYIASKIVTLDNVTFYQEFLSADIMHPHTVYAEKVGEEYRAVKEQDIYSALRRKYAVNKALLDGKIVMD